MYIFLPGSHTLSLTVSYERTQTKPNNCTTIISTYARNTLCLQRFPFSIHPTLLHHYPKLPSLIAPKLQIRSDRTVRHSILSFDFQQTDLNVFTGVGISTCCFCLNYPILPTNSLLFPSSQQHQQQKQQQQQQIFVFSGFLRDYLYNWTIIPVQFSRYYLNTYCVYCTCCCTCTRTSQFIFYLYLYLYLYLNVTRYSTSPKQYLFCTRGFFRT